MNKPQQNGKLRKLIVRILLVALIGGFLGYQIYLLNAEKLVGDSMPMPFGVGMSVVLTGSMEPELSAGDLIVVTEQDSYDVNDVVVYQSGGILVVHRIISVDGDVVITQGDSNNTPDEPIQLSSVKGAVCFSLPMVGRMVSFFKTPIGILLLIGGAILLMELSFRREKQKDADDLDRIKEEIRRLQAQTQNPTDPHTAESKQCEGSSQHESD